MIMRLTTYKYFTEEHLREGGIFSGIRICTMSNLYRDISERNTLLDGISKLVVAFQDEGRALIQTHAIITL